MKWKSIMQETPDRSFLSGRFGVLHKHHCIHGYNRKKAEEDGLYVMLTVDEHRRLHDKGEYDMYLKQKAQEMWMQKFGDEESFRERYGKSYGNFQHIPDG